MLALADVIVVARFVNSAQKPAPCTVAAGGFVAVALGRRFRTPVELEPLPD